MKTLTGDQRRFLNKKAHSLKPVVFVGKAGVNDEVIGALAEALAHHELVKVKFNDHKDRKRELADDLAGGTEASLVSVIGNIAILYRPADDPEDRRYVLPA